MVIDGIVQLFIDLFQSLIGLYRSVTISFSGMTVDYWQILMGSILLGFIIYAFWRGAKTQ